jgi:ABC-type branched-subunit amino acid transport system substrate-binding protein
VRSALRTRATGIGLALLLGAVAACSSAPLPETEQLAVATGGPSGKTAVDPATGQVVDVETGEVVAAGDTATPGDATADAPAGGEGAVSPAGAGGSASSGSGSAGTGSSTAPAGGGGSAGGGPGGGTGAAAPAPPRSTLFSPQEDRIGITDKQLTMCAHAALTYGAAFNTTAEDFNVFWTAVNKEKGGVYGRRVVVSYENDNYSPTEAVTAARACKAKSPFILLGGIGFDQIPAVRNYVEKEHMLYMHHTATVKGSEGLKYSFTALPTVERTGEAFAQLAIAKYKDKKIGIIKRDGANWEPGVDAFKALARKAGLNIVAERAVAANKGNYTDEILAMRNAGAEVVWGWENALISTQIISQAKRQNYHPRWLLFPFNLTSQTLGNDAMNPPLDGVAMFTAFSKGDRSGPFQAYADDLALFERQYAKYRPEADLNGVGGDLLFLNWQAQKSLHDMLLACGKDCTRNRMVDTITSYKKRPTSSACPLDFTRGDRRHGADQLTFMQTYRSPSGKVNWRNTVQCVGPAS